MGLKNIGITKSQRLKSWNTFLARLAHFPISKWFFQKKSLITGVNVVHRMVNLGSSLTTGLKTIHRTLYDGGGGTYEGGDSTLDWEGSWFHATINQPFANFCV